MTLEADKTCPVERMVTQSAELRNSAVASWEGRSKSRFLRAVAALHEICPEACNRPGIWGQHLRPLWGRQPPRDENHPSLLAYIGAMAAWRMEAKTTGIRRGAQIDRRASMIGGAPWTCEIYPWPWGSNGGRPMSPLAQLNLANLDLGAVASFPPILVQVWGDEGEMRVRTLPLGNIEGRQPASLDLTGEDQNLVSPAAFLPDVGNRFNYYKGKRWLRGPVEQMGEYIHVGHATFDLLGGGNAINLFNWSLDNLLIIDDILKERLEREMKRVEKSGRKVVARSSSIWYENHFGGALESDRENYKPWVISQRALFELQGTYSTQDEPENDPKFGVVVYRNRPWLIDGPAQNEAGFGLSIYLEGNLQVTYDLENLETGYQAGASV